MESWSIQQGRGKVTWKREVVRGYSISMDRGEKVRETLGARVLREVCQAYRYLERELRNIGITRKLQTFRLTNLPSLYALYENL